MCAVVALLKKMGNFPSSHLTSSYGHRRLPLLTSPMITGLAARYNLVIILDNINQSCQGVKSRGISPGEFQQNRQFVAVCYQISFILAEAKQKDNG